MEDKGAELGDRLFRGAVVPPSGHWWHVICRYCCWLIVQPQQVLLEVKQQEEYRKMEGRQWHYV